MNPPSPIANPQPAALIRQSSLLHTLQALVQRAEASNVRELEVRAPGFRIALRRLAGPLAIRSALRPPPPAEVPGLHAVRCPLTGIWYDAPSPGAPPYVQAGDSLDVGSVIGLVETMKVFNEVTSDAAGIVRKVLVRRGELVAAHSAILLLEPTEGAHPSYVGGGL